MLVTWLQMLCLGMAYLFKFHAFRFYSLYYIVFSNHVRIPLTLDQFLIASRILTTEPIVFNIRRQDERSALLLETLWHILVISFVWKTAKLILKKKLEKCYGVKILFIFFIFCQYKCESNCVYMSKCMFVCIKMYITLSRKYIITEYKS